MRGVLRIELAGTGLCALLLSARVTGLPALKRGNCAGSLDGFLSKGSLIASAFVHGLQVAPRFLE